MRTKFVIHVPPVTKKNHGQIIMRNGKPILLPSKQYREYEKAAMIFCPKHGIDYPVNVGAVFYMKSRRRVDLANLIEALHDLLVQAGTLADDNCRIIVSVDGCRVDYDKEDPRTEVIIERR